MGVFREFKADPLGFLSRASRVGDVVRFRLGATTFHLVSDPEGIERILVGNAANYLKTGPGRDLVRFAFGDGLPTSDGARWREQRRTAGPAFRHGRIGSLVPTMAKATQAFVQEWEDYASRGESADLAPSLARITLTIAGRAMFGSDLAGRAAAVERALGIVREEVSHRSTSLTHQMLGTSLPTRRNRRFRQGIRELRSTAAAMIEDRRRTPSETDDLLAIFLGEEGAADEAALLDQVVPLLVASHLTTSNTLTWAFYLLSQHPAVLARARREAEEVLGESSPELTHVENLPYIRAGCECMPTEAPGASVTSQTRTNSFSSVAVRPAA